MPTRWKGNAVEVIARGDIDTVSRVVSGLEDPGAV
jgi:hypothetical protein